MSRERNPRRPHAVPRPMARAPFWSACLAIALLTASLVIAGIPAVTAAGSWKGQEVQKDGALHVVNPASGFENPVTVDLKEIFRLGGESESEEEFFGVIMRITTDAKNNIYVLDTQLSEVKIYDTNGKYLKTIGREGEGPGEFRNPADMFFMPDGNIGVMQVFPGKIVMLTANGDPAGDYPLPKPEGDGFQVLRGGRRCGSHLVLARQLQKMSEGKFTQNISLDRLDLQGKVANTYVSMERALDMANLVIDEKTFSTWEQGGRWDAGNDGRVFVVTHNSNYEVTVFNADGTKDRVIERTYEKRNRTAEETAEIKSIYEAFTRQAPGAKVEVNSFDADINSVYSRDDGSLWVLTSRGSRKLPAGVLGVFDVFDDKGHFVRQVTMKGQGNAMKDGYFFVGDRLYVVTGWLDAVMAMQGGGAKQETDTETSPMELICYRVEAPVVAKGK